ncbi:hypothetical protein UlMin_039212 [Ulmus minor]
MIITESAGDEIPMEEGEEARVAEDPAPQLVQSLLTTKLFNGFFNQLDFKEEARKEAIKSLLAIAQKYGPTCYMVGHTLGKMAREQEDVITFSAKDRKQPGPRVFSVDEDKEEEMKLPSEGPKEQANQLEEVNLSSTGEPRMVLISKELTGDLRQAIIDTLQRNRDMFAWTYEEMPGLDASLVTHKLAVTPTQKPNGTIRCCVDYRDLNKACPKDEFPLPNIDTLIDATASHEMFSFMDGFSGYNQIKMAPEDAEKTAFRTPFGNFHYVVMPFGLKNAGATYQRAMTAIFHDMIHDFVEDYVDDLVVKSRKAMDHVTHLQKVFDRCRKYKLKMNPKKCAFGVNMGKFLGVIVHREGITVDEAKAAAIREIPSPKNQDQLRTLIGKVSYLR